MVVFLGGLQGEENYSESGLLKPNTRRRQSTGKYYSDAEPRNFSCTACGMLLRNRDVMKHPTLDVGICRKCKNFLFSGPFNKVYCLIFSVFNFRRACLSLFSINYRCFRLLYFHLNHHVESI